MAVHGKKYKEEFWNSFKFDIGAVANLSKKRRDELEPFVMIAFKNRG